MRVAYRRFDGYAFMCDGRMLEFHRVEITVIFPEWRILMFFRNNNLKSLLYVRCPDS